MTNEMCYCFVDDEAHNFCELSFSTYTQFGTRIVALVQILAATDWIVHGFQVLIILPAEFSSLF